MIGDDALAQAIGGDFDGDGADEIIVALHSGFLALVSADGSVDWVRYADKPVTDAALISLGAGQTGFARSSIDGSVVIYDVTGDELARWHTGTPVQKVSTVTVGQNHVIGVAAANELKVGIYETK